MQAGRLTKRATFQKPMKGRDADGQIILSYPDQFTVWCNVKRLRGGEAVLQARLASRTPAILTVRGSTDTAQITSEWRAVIDGKVYDVKEDPAETDNRLYLEMLVESV
tara:strand:+ start:2516 stop:2839 length:324 start_codon:yes stop_codon:yes gene_type:complete